MKKTIDYLIRLLIIMSFGTTTAQSTIQFKKQVEKPNLGTIWLISVGVSEYENIPFPLKFADEDAIAIRDLFQKLALANDCAFRDTLLVNHPSAKSYDYLSILKQTLLKANPNDLIVFYFSGHGYGLKCGRERNKSEFLLLPNLPSLDIDPYLHGDVLKTSDIIQILNENVDSFSRNMAWNFMFITDACRSRLDTLNCKSNQRIENGIIHISSTTDGGISLEEKDRLRHGVFTYYFLSAFHRGEIAPQGEEVGLRDLREYLEEKILSETNAKQRPIIRGPSEENEKEVKILRPIPETINYANTSQVTSSAESSSNAKGIGKTGNVDFCLWVNEKLDQAFETKNLLSGEMPSPESWKRFNDSSFVDGKWEFQGFAYLPNSTNCIAQEPSGRFLYCGNDNGSIDVISSSDLWLKRRIPLKNSAITNIEISSDGTVLGAIDQNGKITVWNVIGADNLKMINELYTGLSFGGKTVLAIDRAHKTIGAANSKGQAEIWNYETSKKLNSFETGIKTVGIAVIHNESFALLDLDDGQIFSIHNSNPTSTSLLYSKRDSIRIFRKNRVIFTARLADDIFFVDEKWAINSLEFSSERGFFPIFWGEAQSMPSNAHTAYCSHGDYANWHFGFPIVITNRYYQSPPFSPWNNLTAIAMDTSRVRLDEVIFQIDQTRAEKELSKLTGEATKNAWRAMQSFYSPYKHEFLVWSKCEAKSQSTITSYSSAKNEGVPVFALLKYVNQSQMSCKEELTNKYLKYCLDHVHSVADPIINTEDYQPHARQIDTAIIWARSALELSPDKIIWRDLYALEIYLSVIHDRLSGKLVERSEMFQAKQKIQDLRKLLPDAAYPLNLLAILYSMEYDFSSAREMSRNAKSNNHRWTEVPLQLGKTEIRAGRLDSASESFSGAIELSKENYKAYYNLAKTLIQKGAYDKADSVLSNLFEIHPNHPIGLCAASSSYLAQGDFDIADSLSEMAIRLAPDYDLPYLQRGLLFKYYHSKIEARSDYFSEACANFAFALKVNPSSTETIWAAIELFFYELILSNSNSITLPQNLPENLFFASNETINSEKIILLLKRFYGSDPQNPEALTIESYLNSYHKLTNRFFSEVFKTINATNGHYESHESYAESLIRDMKASSQIDDETPKFVWLARLNEIKASLAQSMTANPDNLDALRELGYVKRFEALCKIPSDDRAKSNSVSPGNLYFQLLELDPTDSNSIKLMLDRILALAPKFKTVVRAKQLLTRRLLTDEVITEPIWGNKYYFVSRTILDHILFRNSSGKIGLMSGLGEFLIPAKYDTIISFDFGFLGIFQDQPVWFDWFGNVLLRNFEYDSVKLINADLLLIEKKYGGNKPRLGLAYTDGRIIIPPLNKSIILTGKKKNSYELEIIDHSGNKLQKKIMMVK